MWEFIDTGANTGKFNMDYDIELVDKCRYEDFNFLRFYTWNPYAISLGYNQGKRQSEMTIDKDKCYEDGIDAVVRPTGGRAVYHAEELTYSVVMKTKKPARDIYNEISSVLLNGIKKLNPEKLQELSLVKDDIRLLDLAKTGMYNLCFATAVKYEINYKGKKLVGSAQRNFGDVILQHGSILTGDEHKKIVNYISGISDEKKAILSSEFEKKTVCLKELTGNEVKIEKLKESILQEFARQYSFESVLK